MSVHYTKLRSGELFRFAGGSPHSYAVVRVVEGPLHPEAKVIPLTVVSHGSGFRETEGHGEPDPRLFNSTLYSPHL